MKKTPSNEPDSCEELVSRSRASDVDEFIRSLLESFPSVKRKKKEKINNSMFVEKQSAYISAQRGIFFLFFLLLLHLTNHAKKDEKKPPGYSIFIHFPIDSKPVVHNTKAAKSVENWRRKGYFM